MSSHLGDVRGYPNSRTMGRSCLLHPMKIPVAPFLHSSLNPRYSRTPSTKVIVKLLYISSREICGLVLTPPDKNPCIPRIPALPILALSFCTSACSNPTKKFFQFKRRACGPSIVEPEVIQNTEKPCTPCGTFQATIYSFCVSLYRIAIQAQTCHHQYYSRQQLGAHTDHFCCWNSEQRPALSL